jgi:uncharacterized membrane protein
MELVLWQWGDFLVRWLHVIAGIAWIGSSFYFVHLDSSLRKADSLPEGASGEAWQVHGGGFYHMVKYLVAPARMPEHLTWFYWEAYATWLSGMGLLIIVYYFGASLYMIDPAVLEMAPWVAVLISVVGLVIGWVGYDLLCRSPLGKDDNKLAAVGFVFLVVLAYIFTWLFSGRGAYMQMGALIGTIMAANVLMVIIPGQRKVVAALKAGQEPDPAHGATGKQRSMHNNYLTLPVLFVMISNHYPLAFASRWNWLILAVILVVGAVIRHFYNTRHKGLPSPWWTWGVAAAGVALIVWLSSFPPAGSEEAAAPAEPVTFAQAEEVVSSYCSMCHSEEPFWEGVPVPPKGVMLDTPERIALHAEAIGLQAVMTHAMPPPGAFEMPTEDRAILAAWVAAGTPVE